MQPFKAVTAGYPFISAAIISPIEISTPTIDESTPPTRITGSVNAIWDTGATNSVITQKVIDDLGLPQIRKTKVETADGEMDSEVYLVDFHFSLMGEVMRGINVTRGKLPKHAEALIGMDIITRGDLAITNFQGKTILTFRIPSQVSTDYVKQMSRLAPKLGRPANTLRVRKQKPKKNH
jgi:predicted aspartyl protease